VDGRLAVDLLSHFDARRSTSSASRVGAVLIFILLVSSPTGCRESGHSARGTVLFVDAASGRATIAVEEVPGILPATDAEFVVESAGVLEPAQVIEFSFIRAGTSLRLIDHSVVGRASADDGFVLVADRLLHADPGFPFSLRDQQGRRFGLDDVKDRVVLLDFIFTRCHGPCPAQTQNHVRVQRGLSQAARARTWFVSISIDPETDDEAALRDYAALHGADLSSWSFVTGPVDAVEAVVAGWQIGTEAAESGQIEHTLVSYLLDDRGRIVHRYRSTNPDPTVVRADIEALVAAIDKAPPGG